LNVFSAESDQNVTAGALESRPIHSCLRRFQEIGQKNRSAIITGFSTHACKISAGFNEIFIGF
jgi:hypothetical protein